MKTTIKLIVLTAVLLFGTATLACEAPKRGADMSKDELIQAAKNIVIAELEETELYDRRILIHKLKVVEVLKGRVTAPIAFETYSKTHESFDFNGHTDAQFWAENMGRADWPCCICGPDFTFTKGERYLLFPDAFGAAAAAEIIKSKDDKWLQYVIAKLR